MNRKHTAAHYLDIVAKMRAARADLAFTSDFIVGFPGETEEDFQDTLKLVETVGFAGAYTFAYSVRPGTPAAEMEAQVPEDVKTDRLHRLQALIASQQRAFNASFVGKTLDVLLEKPGRLSGQLVGKSPYLQTVQVMAPPELIGSIVPLAIVDIGTNTLFGALADQPATPVFAAAGA
jgi:tRNA-2-methylthio-N6-dimethylallyladenosine synthase